MGCFVPYLSLIYKNNSFLSSKFYKERQVTWVFPRVSVSSPSQTESGSGLLVSRPVFSLLAPPSPPEPAASPPRRRAAACPPSPQTSLLSGCCWYQSLNLKVSPHRCSPSVSHEDRQSSTACSWSGLSAPQTWWWQRRGMSLNKFGTSRKHYFLTKLKPVT